MILRFPLVSALIFLPLFAQDKTPDPLHPKTTIVVTATRTEVELERAPASAGVITAADLQLRNVQLLDQSLNLAEGTFASRGKGPGDTLAGVGMRGFAGRGGAQSRVLVLLDGEPLNDAYTGAINWQTLPVSEFDRVEVVRGPFSSLYGGNAMGGVIHLVSRPVAHRAGEISAQYGGNNTAVYSTRFSGRFWNRLGLSLGYQRLQAGGYASKTVTASAASGSTGTPVTGAWPVATTSGGRAYAIGDSGRNWWNQHAARARGEYTFNSSTTVFFQFLRQRYGYGYEAYHTYLRDAAGNPVDTGAVLFRDDAGTLRRLSITPTSFLDGPGGGDSNLYHARLLHALTSRQRIEFAGGYFDQRSNWYVTPAAGSTLSTGSGALSERPNRSWHGNAQWGWDTAARQNIVAGGEARREESITSESGLANYAVRDSMLAQTYQAQGRSRNDAAYVQDQMRISGRLLVIAGGRLDHWTTTDGANNSFASGPAYTYADRSRTSATGKVSALYQMTESTSLRASTGTAFRNPTVYDLYRGWRSSAGTTYLANPALEPEKMFSWEAGLRQRIGSRVRLEATYFENRVRALIYRSTDYATDPSGKTLVNRNAGRGLTRGVETSARIKLREWLHWQGAYSYIDATIAENAAVPASVGKRVPNVPRTLASAMLTGARGRWSGSVTGRWVGRFFNTDTNTDIVKGVPGSFDPYFETSGALNCAVTKHLTVFTSADNLLDRRYYQYYLNPGRVVSLGFRAQF